jgi:excisionase family DNA binding protein
VNARKEISEWLDERFVSLKEVAEVLRVNTRTVYRLIQAGQMPQPVKVGRSLRFPVSDVEVYIERLKRSRKGGGV